MKTEQEYLEMAQKEGRALFAVPDSLRAYEVCKEAVWEHRMAFAFVPADLQAAVQRAQAEAGGAVCKN
jgi:hypothetical protein